MRFRYLLLALIALTVFDAGMRRDAAMLCERNDSIPCPASASIWASAFTMLGGTR